MNDNSTLALIITIVLLCCFSGGVWLGSSLHRDDYLNGARDMHTGVLSIIQNEYIVHADSGDYVGRLLEAE